MNITSKIKQLQQIYNEIKSLIPEEPNCNYQIDQIDQIAHDLVDLGLGLAEIIQTFQETDTNKMK